MFSGFPGKLLGLHGMNRGNMISCHEEACCQRDQSERDAAELFERWHQAQAGVPQSTWFNVESVLNSVAIGNIGKDVM